VRPLIETHPRAAPWLAGAMTVALMTLISWLTESGSIAKDVLGIAGAGVSVFLAMVHLRRRRLTRSRDHGRQKGAARTR
jgi:hypothetical protein